MAAIDYRKCDVCGCKTFYDANLNYDSNFDEDGKETGKVKDEEIFKINGKSQVDSHDPLQLDYLGDWAVICITCAKTHKTVIVKV